MNLKDRKTNARRVYNELSKSYNLREGVVKININNTLEHELAKFLICWELAKSHKSFLTEAIWINQSRSDIVVLETAEIIEVIHSEVPDGHKEETYPFPILYIKSDKVMKQLKEKLK